jgi:energy-coupling factor transporter ATP-binding protein EcfA2
VIFRSGNRPPVAYELRFGTDLTAEQVGSVLVAISGIRRGAAVSLEMIATEDGIRHLIRGDQAVLDTLRLQLAALVPTATLIPVNLPLEGIDWQLAARISWSRAHPLLRSDGPADAAASLLSSITHLGPGERVLLRVTVRPGHPRTPPHPRRGQAEPGALARFLFGAPPETHELSQIRAKYAGPLLQAGVLVAVASPSSGRASHLLSRAVGVLRVRRGARGSFDLRVLRGSSIGRALARTPTGGVVLSPAELAPLVGWPIDAPALPGLELGASPVRHPDKRIPTGERVLARSTWPGANNRPLAQPVEGATSHTLIVGPTGVGKSELAAALALADIHAGRGVLIVDGKNDLAAAILERLPAKRIDEVIVVDPAAEGPVPGLRVFGRGSDPELAADVVLGVMRDLFRDHWGIRSESWLRVALVTLAHDSQATLGDLRFLFSDDVYRRRLVGKIRDPLLAATWAAFEAMSPGEKANQLGSPLTKMNELLGRRVVRTILSQPQPTLDLHDVLAKGRIVIAPLSPGSLGGHAARLIGALIIHSLFGAVQGRTKLPPGRRTPFFAYVDEPKLLGDLPVPLDGMFELARGLGVGLTISAQSLSGLPSDIRQAALTNARTLLAFQQNADDAELLAKQLPGISAEQLQHLGQYEIVARIGLGPGDTAAPATGRTLALPAPTIDPNTVRARSAHLYGRDPTEVDQALARRHGYEAAPDDAPDREPPIGRTRRKR